MNLEKNHTEMNTVVETFVIEETASLIYDNGDLQKWNNLVAELNLEGQTQIVKKDKSPIPFLHLKSGLVNTFETLCPRKVEVEKYNISPIPIEILDLVALSKKEEYFDKIQIWYDDKNPDQVCIGLKFDTEEHRRSGYDWYTEKYILGKWADVKRSFSDLIQMASKRFVQEQTNSLKSTIKSCQRQLEDVEQTAFERFGSDVSGNDMLPF